jgi:hypothetical protein
MVHQRFYVCFSLHLQLRCDRFNKLRFKLHDVEHLSEIDEICTHRGALTVVNN